MMKGFEMIGTLYQTKTISNKIDPVWNEFTHCFNADTVDIVTCDLFDQDTFSANDPVSAL